MGLKGLKIKREIIVMLCGRPTCVLTIRIYLVGVWVNQINGDPEVMLSQQLVFVVTLQRCGVVLDKAIGFKRVRHKLRIKGNIG